MSLKTLKNDYLVSINEDIDKLQSLFLKSKISAEEESCIFRIIHSIKGSGATYDFYMLSTIAHQLEDFLANNNFKSLTEDEKDCLLKFIDILTLVINDYSKNDTKNFDHYLNVLSNIQQLEASKQEYYGGKILVVDATTTMGNLLKRTLEEKGYQCSISKNGLSAFNRLVNEKYDAVFTSLNLEILDGVSLTSALKSTSNINSNIPVAVISASTNIESRFPVHSRPDYIISKDDNLIESINNTLEKIFTESHLTSKQDGPERILYVEDDPKMQKLFKLSIQKTEGVEVEIATDKKSAIEKCKQFKPDIIILDQYLKNEKGEDIFIELLDFNIPIIFLTGSEGSIDVEKLKNHSEFKGIITKPFRPAAIYNQICQFI
ncbi:response regulator [Bacteriovorax sp. Seq25_V]|uniref:response regulator n=1 Tax=Bacteriovorax sp. Seq25_V TaxID=1201288 RepID=UPI00038A0C6C|nr:response regulator [Bacteriovorax sp. Seq25_V]EQC46209.1 response regulator receiver domain protein [Bacteriovorax sp. Seq25_V]